MADIWIREAHQVTSEHVNKTVDSKQKRNRISSSEGITERGGRMTLVFSFQTSFSQCQTDKVCRRSEFSLSSSFSVREQSGPRGSRHRQGEHPLQQGKPLGLRGGTSRQQQQQQRGLAGRRQRRDPQTQEPQPHLGAAHPQPGRPCGEWVCRWRSTSDDLLCSPLFHSRNSIQLRFIKSCN